jgi:probable HAF family extracellular repeat protein
MESMHGIVWHDGKVTRYPVPFSMNNGINERKEIVGFYVDASTGIRHSYLLRKGVATLIDFPSATATLAWGMNNRRQVVGWYQKKDGVVHGFIWHEGRFTSVDIPGATETVVLGINSVGDIVGIYVDATTGHGFLLRAKDTESGGGDDK